jgi:hypothetical protein
MADAPGTAEALDATVATTTEEVDPMVLNVNLDHLTTGEIEIIEDITDAPITWMADEDKPKGKGLVALAFVMGRRTNPDYTMEEARNMRVSLVNPDENPVPPTESATS